MGGKEALSEGGRGESLRAFPHGGRESRGSGDGVVGEERRALTAVPTPLFP